MNLKGPLVFASAVLILQGCASAPSGKNLASELAVYPDNRIGYRFTQSGSADFNRVWSNDNNRILALRFKNRHINAKDIDSVTIFETRKSQTPIGITVLLKSGERLSAEIADWGSELGSEGKIEWAACSVDKLCQYLNRKDAASYGLIFPGAPDMLTVVRNSAIHDSAKKQLISGLPLSADALKKIESHNLDEALPRYQLGYKMKFEDFTVISDIQVALQAAVVEQQALAKCVSEVIRQETAKRQAYEQKVLSNHPTVKDLDALDQWKKMQSTGSGQIANAEMACSSGQGR